MKAVHDNFFPGYTMNDLRPVVSDIEPNVLPPRFTERVYRSVNDSLTLSFAAILISLVFTAFCAYSISTGKMAIPWLYLQLASFVFFQAMLFVILSQLVDAVSLVSGARFPISKKFLLLGHLIPLFNLYWLCRWPAVFNVFIKNRARDKSEHTSYMVLTILSFMVQLAAAPAAMLLRFIILMLISNRVAAYADSVFQYHSLGTRPQPFFTWKKVIEPVMSAIFVAGAIAIIVHLGAYAISKKNEEAIRQAEICYTYGNYICIFYEMNEAITFSPGNPELYAWRGAAYRMGGNYFRAEKDFDRALELDSNNASAYYQKGLAAIIKGKKWSDALKNLNRAIEIEPDNSEYLTARSVVYFKRGKKNQALKDAKKAFEIDPNNKEAKELIEIIRGY